MRMVIISEQDAQQVAAILNTHAEMQDQRSVENLELMSGFKVDFADDHEAQCMIASMAVENETLDEDCDNLRRIAKIFM